MQHIYVEYRDEETGNNFTYSKDYESHFIPDSINTMLDVLRLIGFGDGLIEKWLGYSYFTLDDPPVSDEDYDDDEYCDCCGRCD